MKFAAEGAGALAFVNTLNAAVLGVHGKVANLNSTLGKLAISAAAVGSGLLILSSFKAPLDEASKMQTAMARFAQFGMDGRINKAAENYARATKVMGTSTVDMMNNIIEAQGIFREAGNLNPADQFVGAKIMAPIMAKIQFAQRALGRAEMTHADDRNMLRFIEDRGGATDPDKAARLAEMGFKLINSSGGQVKWSDLSSIIVRSAALGRTITDDGLVKLEPIIAAMGGGTVGSGLRTAYNRMMGFQRLIPKNAIAEFLNLGLWDRRDIEFNSQGGIKSFKHPGTTLKDYVLESQDPIAWYQKYFLPAIEKRYGHDVAYGQDAKSIAKREAEINLIYGGGSTGATVYTRIDQMLPNIQRSIETQRKALGIDASDKLAEGTLMGKRIILEKNWQTLMLQTGEVILPMAIKGMGLLNKAVVAVGNFAEHHKTAFSFIVDGIAALGVALTAFGALSFFSIGLSAIAAAGPVLTSLGAAVAGVFLGPVAPIALAVAAVAGLGIGIGKFIDAIRNRNRELMAQHPPGQPGAKPGAKPNPQHPASHPQGFWGALWDNMASGVGAWWAANEAHKRAVQMKVARDVEADRKVDHWGNMVSRMESAFPFGAMLIKLISSFVTQWAQDATKRMQAETQANLKAEANSKAIIAALNNPKQQNFTINLQLPNGAVLTTTGTAVAGRPVTAKPSGFNGARQFQNPGATGKR